MVPDLYLDHIVFRVREIMETERFWNSLSWQACVQRCGIADVYRGCNTPVLYFDVP